MRDVPFGDFAAAMLEQSMVRPGTLTDYRRLARIASASIGHVPVQAVTRDQIRRALADASATLAPKSVRNLLAFIRQVLREAGNGVAAEGITVAVPQSATRALTAEEAELLHAQLQLSEELAADALHALLGTGIRLGELLALQGSDYDARRQVLHISRSITGPTKSGRSREVDVPDRLAARLSQLAENAGPRKMFPTSPRCIQRAFQRVLSAAGLPHFRVHDLRHTRLTQLLLSGVPPLYVSQQAGHHSPSYTMTVYGHLVAASDGQRRAWCNA